MKHNRIEIKPGKNGKSHVNYVDRNNKVVSTTEVFNSKEAAKKNIEAMKKIIKDHVIVDKTKPSPKKK